MKIVFVLKNGFTFYITCEEFALTKNGLEEYTGCNIKGMKGDKLLFVRWEDVALIYRADGQEVTE